jgi:hypothetical protein
MLDLYGVSDKAIRDHLVQIARESGQRAWWVGFSAAAPSWAEVYIGFESEAAEIRSVEAVIMPGLLQTEAYATELFRTGNPVAAPEDIESLVALRMTRRDRLLAEPPQLQFVIGEAALRCRVGSRTVMHEQMRYLAENAGSRHVEIRILPFASTAYAAFGPFSFVIMDFAQPDDPGLVYTEQWGAGVILDEESTVQRYRQIYQHVVAGSLSVAASGKMIRDCANSWR